MSIPHRSISCAVFYIRSSEKDHKTEKDDINKMICVHVVVISASLVNCMRMRDHLLIQSLTRMELRAMITHSHNKDIDPP